MREIDEELFAAVVKNDLLKIQKLLSDGADVNARDQHGNTLLYWAVVVQGNPKLIQFLVDNGADPNLQNENGLTSLYRAVQEKDDLENYLKITEILIKAGADVNPEQDKNKHSILHWAVYVNNFKLVQLLVDNGANINLQDRNGETALHWAIQERNLDIIKFLVVNRADPDIQNKKGETALYKAVSKGYPEIVKFLLKIGADPDLQNKSNDSLLNIAVKNMNEYRHKDIFYLIFMMLASKTDFENILSTLVLYKNLSRFVDDSIKRFENYSAIVFLLLSSDIHFSLKQREILKEELTKNYLKTVQTILSLDCFLELSLDSERFFKIIDIRTIKEKTPLDINQAGNLLSIALHSVRNNSEQIKFIMEIIDRFSFDQNHPRLAELLTKLKQRLNNQVAKNFISGERESEIQDIFKTEINEPWIL